MTTADIRALILTGFGLNCDHETAHTLELAGARPVRVHINSLIKKDVSLDAFHILVFGGGFSWGDDHGAGVVQAVRMKTAIGEDMIRFVESGRLVIGICNGFQTLVNLGLLPGVGGDYRKRSVALMANDCGNFQDRWVHLAVDPDAPCVFTRGLDRLEFPIRHGEGKFFTDAATLRRLGDNHQAVLRYATPEGDPANGVFPHNPNGSLEDIAGICDPSGRVFGLMPHPEAYNHFTNHPDWALRLDRAKRTGTPPDPGPTPGVRLFQNAVAYLRSAVSH